MWFADVICRKERSMRAKKAMLTKSMIRDLNVIALGDFWRASLMLDGINMVLGTKYGWCNRRVCVFDDPDAADKYAHAHDAWACAD